jgi:hypothetical protein
MGGAEFELLLEICRELISYLVSEFRVCLKQDADRETLVNAYMRILWMAALINKIVKQGHWQPNERKKLLGLNKELDACLLEGKEKCGLN